MDICSAVHFLEGVGESYLYAFVIIFFINVFQITEIMKYIINQILMTLKFSQLLELKLTVEGLEKERDFYFGKLRDVEVLCQENDSVEGEAVRKVGLLKL